MARSTSRLSESERGQRRARDRERLKVAAEQLLTLEGWERWVHVRSPNGLSRYCIAVWIGGRCRCVLLRGLPLSTRRRRPFSSL